MFFGFDPGPGAKIGSQKANLLDLSNMEITDLKASDRGDSYDLVIASHVMEHVLDFRLLLHLNGLLAENALLYVEVPNSLRYESYHRREFLYYFDRLHVNHFTPQAAATLAAAYGFGYVRHFEYAFPYRDGADFPGLGCYLEKEHNESRYPRRKSLDAANRYIAQERRRAETVVKQFDKFEGILVWGGSSDNLFRSAENGGPLSGPLKMVLLDRRQQEIVIGKRRWSTVDPEEGILRNPWPVVITISEGRLSVSEEVKRIDPSERGLLYLATIRKSKLVPLKIRGESKSGQS